MDIRPFKALRPVRDKVHLVATRPFYTYRRNVLKAKMQSNPYSFLHIINPDFDLHGEEAEVLDLESRLNLVKEQYQRFIDEGILITDETPSIYVYRQSGDNHEYTGIIAATSACDYNEDKVKKHEATLTKREKLFTKYLDLVGYNAEPVLLCHEKIDGLDTLLDQATSQRPEYEFTTTDRLKHELWILPSDVSQQISEYFKEIDACYIADGHHRSASSVALNQLRLEKNRSCEKDGYFLSFLIDESKLKVFEYNRIVRNIEVLSEKEFINALTDNFEVKLLEEKRKSNQEHEIIMMMNDNWYSLICKDQIVEADHPVKSLDAEILTNYVLTPILGIKDLKTDKNVEFVSGAEKLEKVKKTMYKGGFDIAFFLYPVSMDQVKKVADNNMIMPPKSTWVEPKMRSGLTIYSLNE